MLSRTVMLSRDCHAERSEASASPGLRCFAALSMTVPVLMVQTRHLMGVLLLNGSVTTDLLANRILCVSVVRLARCFS
jgi:hypothetical protein